MNSSKNPGSAKIFCEDPFSLTHDFAALVSAFGFAKQKFINSDCVILRETSHCDGRSRSGYDYRHPAGYTGDGSSPDAYRFNVGIFDIVADVGEATVMDHNV